MSFKILSKIFYLLIMVIPITKSEIQLCTNTTTDIVDICTLSKVYEPAIPAKPWPQVILIYIHIFDIVDIDWTSNTVTQIIQLWSLWNDTRISLTKSHYGYCYNLFISIECSEYRTS